MEQCFGKKRRGKMIQDRTLYWEEEEEDDRGQFARVIGRGECDNWEEDWGLNTVLGLTDDKDKHTIVTRTTYLIESWKLRNWWQGKERKEGSIQKRHILQLYAHFMQSSEQLKSRRNYQYNFLSAVLWANESCGFQAPWRNEFRDKPQVFVENFCHTETFNN